MKGGFSTADNAAAAAAAAAGQSQASNNATAVLGLTSTTNALSGKVSATTASKVNVPNLPPGVASMLPPQYMASLPAAAFYGLQQPTAAMYSAAAYGSAGLEDLAALQRQAGLHTLQTTGYYDPSSQYAATSLAAAAGRNQNQDGGSSLNSLSTSAVSSSTTLSGSSS